MWLYKTWSTICAQQLLRIKCPNWLCDFSWGQNNRCKSTRAASLMQRFNYIKWRQGRVENKSQVKKKLIRNHSHPFTIIVVLDELWIVRYYHHCCLRKKTASFGTKAFSRSSVFVFLFFAWRAKYWCRIKGPKWPTTLQRPHSLPIMFQNSSVQQVDMIGKLKCLKCPYIAPRIKRLRCHP